MPPFTSLIEIVLSTILYVSCCVALRTRVRRHGAYNHAATILRYHSCLQVVVSAMLLTLTILSLLPTTTSNHDSVWRTMLKTAQENGAFLPRYLHHLSRIWEYFDMILFIAAGNVPDLHFAFHHLTTPYLTYFRLMGKDYRGWQIFCGLNGFHHVLMHMFFAGVKDVQPILPWTRTIQLEVGIMADMWLIWTRREGSGLGYLVSVVLLSCYYVLLSREVRMKAVSKEPRAGGEEQVTVKSK